jgi:hypothetical protein
MPVFTVAYRAQVRESLIETARADPEIVAAAAVGSSAGGSDRWSDLDLTFAVSDAATVEAVLARWTALMREQFSADVLFDIAVGPTIYRVFLLPGALQVDLSFSPAAQFEPRTPRFRLLFGTAAEHPSPVAPPNGDEIFGLGVHYAMRAYICIERGQLWQAEYLLHGARDYALTFACYNRNLETRYARGFDLLPVEVLAAYEATFIHALTEAELRRALAVLTTALLDEGASTIEYVRRLRLMLDEITAPTGA